MSRAVVRWRCRARPIHALSRTRCPCFPDGRTRRLGHSHGTVRFNRHPARSSGQVASLHEVLNARSCSTATHARNLNADRIQSFKVSATLENEADSPSLWPRFQASPTFEEGLTGDVCPHSRVRPDQAPHMRRHEGRPGQGPVAGKQPKLSRTQESHLVSWCPAASTAQQKSTPHQPIRLRDYKLSPNRAAVPSNCKVCARR